MRRIYFVGLKSELAAEVERVRALGQPLRTLEPGPGPLNSPSSKTRPPKSS